MDYTKEQYDADLADVQYAFAAGRNGRTWSAEDVYAYLTILERRADNLNPQQHVTVNNYASPELPFDEQPMDNPQIERIDYGLSEVLEHVRQAWREAGDKHASGN